MKSFEGDHTSPQLVVSGETGGSSSDAASRRLDELFAKYRDTLRRTATALLAKARPGPTLQPTVLVHEAYIKLALRERPWDNLDYFFGAITQAMRDYLADRAAAKDRIKRLGKHGEGRKLAGLDGVDIVDERAPAPSRILERMDLEHAFKKLFDRDRRAAVVVQLKYLCDWTNEQIASELNVSSATVKRDWAWGLALLHKYMEAEGAAPRG